LRARPTGFRLLPLVAALPLAGAEGASAQAPRIRIAQPHPLLPVDLAAVATLSRTAGQGAQPEAFNFGSAAIGTGPDRFGSLTPGQPAELTRNPAYRGAAPPRAPATIRVIGNPPVQLRNAWATRTAPRWEPRRDDRTLAMGVRTATN
jgi:ABC-type transport system substrate-binding protein